MLSCHCSQYAIPRVVASFPNSQDANYKDGEFESLLRGHLGPGFYQGQPQISGTTGFRYHPKVKDRIHAVILVLDGQAVQGNERFATRYQDFARALLKEDYRFVIVVTKMDLLDPALIQASAQQIMESQQATQVYHRLCRYASVQPNEIFPCKPYLNEYERNKSVETIPLMALAQAVEHGMQFYRIHTKEVEADEMAEIAQYREQKKRLQEYKAKQLQDAREKQVAKRNAVIVQFLRVGLLVLMLIFVLGYLFRR